MTCLRCGWCCQHLWVLIVDDPQKGFFQGRDLNRDNIIEQRGDGTPCKHLRGDKPGEYKCAVHDRWWYEETPCFRHGQIEPSPDTPCRIGERMLQLEEVESVEGKHGSI